RGDGAWRNEPAPCDRRGPAKPLLCVLRGQQRKTFWDGVGCGFGQGPTVDPDPVATAESPGGLYQHFAQGEDGDVPYWTRHLPWRSKCCAERYRGLALNQWRRYRQPHV